MKLYKDRNFSFCAVILMNRGGMELKIKIISEKFNPLLKRKEVEFELDHSEEGQTSSRLELKEKLVDMLKAKPDLVFVEKVETKTGTTMAQGEANIYESAEQAKLVEREHIIARNSPLPKPVKEEPVKEEPVKEEPVKEEPVKEEPVKEEPVKEEPVKEEPVKEEPVKERVKEGNNRCQKK